MTSDIQPKQSPKGHSGASPNNTKNNDFIEASKSTKRKVKKAITQFTGSQSNEYRSLKNEFTKFNGKKILGAKVKGRTIAGKKIGFSANKSAVLKAVDAHLKNKEFDRIFDFLHGLKSFNESHLLDKDQAKTRKAIIDYIEDKLMLNRDNHDLLIQLKDHKQTKQIILNNLQAGKMNEVTTFYNTLNKAIQDTDSDLHKFKYNEKAKEIQTFIETEMVKKTVQDLAKLTCFIEKEGGVYDAQTSPLFWTMEVEAVMAKYEFDHGYKNPENPEEMNGFLSHTYGNQSLATFHDQIKNANSFEDIIQATDHVINDTRNRITECIQQVQASYLQKLQACRTLYKRQIVIQTTKNTLDSLNRAYIGVAKSTGFVRAHLAKNILKLLPIEAENHFNNTHPIDRVSFSLGGWTQDSPLNELISAAQDYLNKSGTVRPFKKSIISQYQTVLTTQEANIKTDPANNAIIKQIQAQLDIAKEQNKAYQDLEASLPNYRSSLEAPVNDLNDLLRANQSLFKTKGLTKELNTLCHTIKTGLDPSNSYTGSHQAMLESALTLLSLSLRNDSEGMDGEPNPSSTNLVTHLKTFNGFKKPLLTELLKTPPANQQQNIALLLKNIQTMIQRVDDEMVQNEGPSKKERHDELNTLKTTLTAIKQRLTPYSREDSMGPLVTIQDHMDRFIQSITQPLDATFGDEIQEAMEASFFHNDEWNDWATLANNLHKGIQTSKNENRRGYIKKLQDDLINLVKNYNPNDPSALNNSITTYIDKLNMYIDITDSPFLTGSMQAFGKKVLLLLSLLTNDQHNINHLKALGARFDFLKPGHFPKKKSPPSSPVPPPSPKVSLTFPRLEMILKESINESNSKDRKKHLTNLKKGLLVIENFMQDEAVSMDVLEPIFDSYLNQIQALIDIKHTPFKTKEMKQYALEFLQLIQRKKGISDKLTTKIGELITTFTDLKLPQSKPTVKQRLKGILSRKSKP